MKNTTISDRIIELSIIVEALRGINNKINYIRKHEMIADPNDEYEAECNAVCEKRIAVLEAIADKL